MPPRGPSCFDLTAADLVRHLLPCHPPAQVKAYLEASVVDLGDPDKDDTYGSGHLLLGLPPANTDAAGGRGRQGHVDVGAGGLVRDVGDPQAGAERLGGADRRGDMEYRERDCRSRNQ
jgi:hypothetical protein